VELLRRGGLPDAICVDLADHDLQSADAAMKIQVKYPRADLVALLEEDDRGRTEALQAAGVDRVLPWRMEWAVAVQHILEQRAQLSRLGWIGKSEPLRQLASQTLQAAGAEIAVLVTGESGTGKELVARALHEHSERRRGPFVAVNTGAIPETLLESELFGHEKGAFTGAASRHRGIFEAADGGTVFLDEIGDMPAATQVKLLRVLETHRFRRVGGTEELTADVRIVSATHRDLSALERGGSFRQDLYYRLSAIRLHASPLRERLGDLLPLLTHFWRSHAGQSQTPSGVEPSALRLLWKYHWPGNVRELRNFAEASTVGSDGGPLTEHDVMRFIERQRIEDRSLPALTDHPRFASDKEVLLHAVLHLGQEIRELKRLIEDRLPPPEDVEPAAFRPPSTSIADAERRAIENALIETDGNRREAARRLGIGERTLYRKIKEYGLK